MRRSRLCFVVLAAAGVLAGPLPAGAEVALRGRVVGGDDRPLPGARVTLRPMRDDHHAGRRLLEGLGEAKAAASVRTDDRGAFELTVPEIGLWRLTVEAEGRVSMTRVFRPLLYDETLDDARLPAADTLTVTVTGGGSPLAGVLVDVLTSRDFALWRETWESSRWWPARRAALTGDDGRAILPHAPGERPRVHAVKAGFRPAAADAGARASMALEPSPLRTFAVVDARGEPAAGVLFLDGWRPLGRTGDDGTVELTEAHLERGASALVADAGDGYRATLAAFAAGTGALRLPPVYEVRGRVVDRDGGGAIPGALVWSNMGPAVAVRTDARGRFRWRTAAESLRLGFAAEGYRWQWQIVDATAGISSDLAVALEPAAILAGRVVDEDGLPVAGATVEVRSSFARRQSWNAGPGYRSAATAADGSFRFDTLSADEPQDLRVHHRGYAPAAAAVAAVVPAGGPPEIEIVLRRGAVVSGHAVDADGRAIAGVRARLYHRPGRGEARLEIPEDELLSAPEAVTGTDGRFEIRGVPAGEHVLELRRPDYATRTVPGVRIDDSLQPLDLAEIALSAAAAIEVRVTDPAGEPIAGVQVRLTPRTVFGGSRPVAVPSHETRRETGADGIVRFEDLAAGERVDLRLDHPSYVEEHAELVEAPTREPFAVVLRPGVTIAGTVVGAGGRGVARASLHATTEVRIESQSRRGTRHFGRSTYSDAGGRFELHGVHPGEVRLSARAHGFAEGVVRLVLAEGERRDDLRVELHRGAAISGRVLDPQGRPVVGGAVTVRQRESESESRGGGSATTDGEGRFRIAGQPAGRMEISARHREHGAASVEIDLVPGENPLDLTLSPTRGISGRVVDPSGRPVPEAQVFLTRKSDSATIFSSTPMRADGTFFFEPEQPGDYELTAEREDMPRVSLPLTVGDEPISGLELVLREGAAIIGTVLGVSAEERNRVTIWAFSVPSRDRNRQGTVDAGGRYRIAGLFPAAWEVQAVLPGTGRRAVAKVEILAGESEALLDLELEGGGLRLTGSVHAGGGPAAGATVSVAGAEGSYAWMQTGRDGRFRLEDLEPGAYTLRISGDWGHYAETVELWSDRDLAVSFELRRVSGRLISGAGEPLAGANVALVEEAAGFGSTSSHTFSDAGGGFVFARVRAARYRLVAALEGFATATAIVEADLADVEDLEIVLTADR